MFVCGRQHTGAEMRYGFWIRQTAIGRRIYEFLRSIIEFSKIDHKNTEKR